MYKRQAKGHSQPFALADGVFCYTLVLTQHLAALIDESPLGRRAARVAFDKTGVVVVLDKADLDVYKRQFIAKGNDLTAHALTQIDKFLKAGSVGRYDEIGFLCFTPSGYIDAFLVQF